MRSDGFRAESNFKLVSRRERLNVRLTEQKHNHTHPSLIIIIRMFMLRASKLDTSQVHRKVALSLNEGYELVSTDHILLLLVPHLRVVLHL